MNEYSFKKRAGNMFLEPNGKEKTDKYHKILDAAIKVFAEQGFFRSTISQIAKEAGVADGTIYLYFKNKDDILLQFYSDKTRKIFNKFREAVDKSENSGEKFRNLIRCHLREFQRDRNMAVVYMAEARKGQQLDSMLDELTKMYLDVVGEVVEQGQAEGRFRKDLYLSLVKRYILGGVEAVISTWVYAGGKYDLESMADPLVDLFLRGIGSNGVAAGEIS
ncbi:MAG: TetR/AcrR family transcriptional regulator [Pseudomonadota bacterium]